MRGTRVVPRFVPRRVATEHFHTTIVGRQGTVPETFTSDRAAGQRGRGPLRGASSLGNKKKRERAANKGTGSASGGRHCAGSRGGRVARRRKGTRTQPVAAKGQLVEVLPYLDAEVATIVRGAIKHVDDWMHLHFGERAIEIDDSQPPPTSAGESKGEKVEDTNEPETQPWPPRPPSTEKGA